MCMLYFSLQSFLSKVLNFTSLDRNVYVQDGRDIGLEREINNQNEMGDLFVVL